MTGVGGGSLETERLTFRPLTRDDLPFLQRLQAKADVMRLVCGKARGADEVAQSLESYFAHWKRYGYGFSLVSTRAQGTPVGYAGFRQIERLDAPEIGYVADTPFWGQGLAGEAVLALLAHGFEHYDFPQILATVEKTHARSERLCERMGMKLISYGTFDGLSCKLFGIDKDEWQSGKTEPFVPFDEQ